MAMTSETPATPPGPQGQTTGQTRRPIWRLVRIGLAGFVLAALVAVGLAAWQADRRVQDEPPIAASAGPSVLVLGIGGDVIASRGGFVGRALTPDELPKRLVDAVV